MLEIKDKTKLARLKRKWMGQEIDKIIWWEGIYSFFEKNHFNLISFNPYELYKILENKDLKYPITLNKIYFHLKKYEKEGYLFSFITTNERNRKVRLYSLTKRYLFECFPEYIWQPYHIKPSGKYKVRDKRVQAQKEYENLKNLLKN